MSPELLSSVAGILLSLIASYVPGVAEKFDELDGTYKRFVMAIMLVVVAVASAFWSCSASRETSFAICLYGVDWKTIASSIVAALVANQAAFHISPKSDTE